LIVIGVVVVAFLGSLAAALWMLRRRDARRVARVTSGAADYLRNVLVPDGNGGDYHLDFVLLTSRGVVIIDMRDIIGNVFGGDQMTDWTLIEGARRTTFVEPAVRSLRPHRQRQGHRQRYTGGRAHRVHQARQVSEGTAAFHRDAGIRGRGVSETRRGGTGYRGVQVSARLAAPQGSGEAEPALSCEPGRGCLKNRDSLYFRQSGR
jgi:hypothetical protein